VFGYTHLRGDLQETSQGFYMLAVAIVDHLPANPERDVSLRKLLEAKDAAVRAHIIGTIP
jgi:hypothetical protein